MKSMNIVHVVACYPPHAGGMERNTEFNAIEMAKRGHSVTVFTSDEGFKSAVIQTLKNLKVYYLKSFTVAHTPIFISLIPKLLNIPKDSVVHMHVAQAYVPEITYLFCKLRGIPYLAHIHLDIDQTGPMGFILPFYKKFLLGPILRGADAVTVLTPDYKDLMEAQYKVKRDKIKLIPNGTYYNFGKEMKTKVHKPLKILFVGRLSAQKNIPLLLNSIALCVHKYKIPLKLKIVGEGDEKQQTLALIQKLKIGKYIEMITSNDYDSNQLLFREADVFLLTSKAEAFGTVVVEALASGTPVIATNIFSVRNIITDGYNGFLVKHDPEDFAQAINKINEDKNLYKEMVKNGIASTSNFKWKKVIDAYENLYRSILESYQRNFSLSMKR